MTPARIIGRSGALPWHFSEDLKFFKRTTKGHPVVMGRKTYESIGKPLPHRQNIVLTKDPCWSAEDVEIIHSADDLTSLPLEDSHVFIIGGAQVYSLFLPRIDDLLVSWIYTHYEGDTYFPEFPGRFHEYEVLEKFDAFEVRRYFTPESTSFHEVE